MKKTVTKKQIIHAIKTEPLISGFWIRPKYIGTEKDCPVCAVGAVLRAAGANALEIDDYGSNLVAYHDGVAGKVRAEGLRLSVYQAKNGDYMAALSTRFEAIADDNYCDLEPPPTVLDRDIGTPDFTNLKYASNKVRRNLVKFVEKHFPNKVTL